jgi:3-hydroxyisobutyrate dehydrogenase
MKIGLLGTGLMGEPMALRFIAAGHQVTAYNRTASKLEAIATAGGTTTTQAAEVLQAAEVVILMLSDRAAIDAVLWQDDVTKQIAGQTFIQMGTIAPQESRDLAAKIRAAGGDYLEATVLGSIPQVKAGTLLVMVGCDMPQQYMNYTTLFKVLGEKPIHVGKIGAAAALKLALNQLIGSLTTAFALSLKFVQTEGLDVDIFMNILRESALYAPTFDKKLQRMVDEDFTNPNFPTKHLLKDMELFQDATPGYQNDLVQGVITVLKTAIASGHQEDDYSALFTAIAPD